jgi:uncharacterized protein
MAIPNEDRLKIDGTILLSGIVGSTAYGLATASSDVDRLGMYVAPTERFLGLHKPKESLVVTEPDITMHEVGKYCALALKCNPTVMELMWLPLGLYEKTSALGQDLIDIRRAFLSAPYVRNAYLGYASQQFRRLESRGDGSFSADTRKRTAKHARHLARLIDQGTRLHLEGTLMIELPNPDYYREFGEDVARGNVERARLRLIEAEEIFDRHKGALPDTPDEDRVERYLQHVRRAAYLSMRARLSFGSV